jgi:hypothetical protein
MPIEARRGRRLGQQMHLIGRLAEVDIGELERDRGEPIT